MKDLFSQEADLYRKFRPEYPSELYAFILQHGVQFENAWDCGTGNGQVASVLAKSYAHVYATDISTEQLANATPAPNITYSVQPAEKVGFPDKFFDLVTVGQALHWFRFPQFYAEVKRVLKPQGLLAVFGYGPVETPPEFAYILHKFYTETTGPFWEPERAYVDQAYKTIPFPFREIASPVFLHRVEWTCSECIGYITTWSAVKHMVREAGDGELKVFETQLRKHWTGEDKRIFRFPVFLRLGIPEA